MEVALVKFIFIIFFLATAGIAFVVKSAARGVKAGLEYTSKLGEQESAASPQTERAKLESMKEFLLSGLGTQKEFLSDGDGKIPEEGKDDFSCGYVWGYCQALLRGCSVTDAGIFDCTSFTFIELYGLDDGSRLFANVINKVGAGAHAQAGQEFVRGVLVGEHEIKLWMNEEGTKNFPMGWSEHVSQIRKGAAADEAVKRLRLAADQGDAKAQYILGMMYDSRRDVPQNGAEAVKWFRLAAAQGDASAQYSLGVYYNEGRGVPQDYAEAVKWFRLAADQGHARAQHQVGFMYDAGLGVPEDYAEAVKWYRRAADQGLAEAQHNLGLMYIAGLGVPQDYAEAVKWFRLAADQGHAGAQHNLGRKYACGQGVPPDYVCAYMWLNLAAAQGDNDAAKNRDLAAQHMTPEQIAEAQKPVREWKPTTQPTKP